MDFDDPSVDDVVDRFLSDITDCVDGVNMALPHYGRELKSIKFDCHTGSIDIELEETRVIH